MTQEVLLAVSKAVGRWDANPSRGSFRGWLATITRNLIVNFLIRQDRHPRGTGDSDFARWLDQVPSPDCHESQLFALEHRRQLFLRATAEIETEFRPETWRAFWETSVVGRVKTAPDAATNARAGAGLA